MILYIKKGMFAYRAKVGTKEQHRGTQRNTETAVLHPNKLDGKK